MIGVSLVPNRDRAFHDTRDLELGAFGGRGTNQGVLDADAARTGAS